VTWSGARRNGAEGIGRLARVHAVSTGADACIAVALAGSLFFNTSLDVARPRLALYLALTLAPVALMTPLIGPAVARLGVGRRLLADIGRARALFALLLVVGAGSFWLYPESLAVLVLGRAYAVVKRSLIPSLVRDPSELVAANARMSRIGSVSGLLGAIVGTGILHFGRESTVLLFACVLHLVAVVLVRRLPGPPVIAVASAAPQRRAPRVPMAAVPPLAAMTALRIASGFAVVGLALALEQFGEPAATLAFIALAVSTGSFAGTFVSPHLRHVVGDERLILGVGSGVAAVVAVVAAALPTIPAMLIAIFLLAVVASVGRHACDSAVQRFATHTTRPRAFAWCEATLQVGWVLGALVPTVAILDARSALLVTGMILTLGSVVALHNGLFAAGRRLRYPSSSAARSASTSASPSPSAAA
jgi:hypothetical protein